MILLITYVIMETFVIDNVIFHLIEIIALIIVTSVIVVKTNRLIKSLISPIVESINMLNENFCYVPPYSGIYTLNEVKSLLVFLKESIQRTIQLRTKYSNAMVEIKYHEQLRDLLFLISDRIINSTDPNLTDVYEFIIDKAIEVVPDATKGSLTLVNSEDNMDFIAARGYDWENLKHVTLPIKDTFLWKYSRGKVSTPIIVRNVQDFNTTSLPNEAVQRLMDSKADTIQSTLTAPIYLDDKLIGTLNLDSSDYSAFDDEDKKAIGFFTSLIGIALKNRVLMEETIFLSRHDKLTGIYNRRYFEELFSQFQDLSFRHNHKFSICIMDLNYLKKINDNFGHVIGDMALKGFVDRVKSHLGDKDVFARYGGDEFIIIFPNTSYDESQNMMEQIFNDFRGYYIMGNGVRIPIQFSYGIAHSPDESMILDILVKVADGRMYDHKRVLKEENLKNELFSVYHS